jgi:hypothetical protein
MEDNLIDWLIRRGESTDSPLLKLLIERQDQAEGPPEAETDEAGSRPDATADSGIPAAAYTR